MSFAKSPFYRLHQLAEQCFGHLESDFHPRELWSVDDPELLADAIHTLRGVVEALESGLHRLAAEADERFRSILELAEWDSLEKEAPEWLEMLKKLRPTADAEHVKRQVLAIRVRISELVDGLAVRAAVRDPGSRADNSQQAVKSVARLQKERQLREIALSLLEGVTLQEILDGDVADWSIHFGPQHRIELGRLCARLGDALGRLEKSGASPALRRLVQSTAETREKLDAWNRRLSEIPVTQVDAGTASDFHYLAGLARKVVANVSRQHPAILSEFAGRELPPLVAGLFELLSLKVQKVRPRITVQGSSPQVTTREELERELGRHIISPVKGRE